MTTDIQNEPLQAPQSHADRAADTERSVPAVTIILLLAGLAVMILAAANLMNLAEWAQRWGQIPVFLGFFLVMAIAGRWFWTGVDALIAALRGTDG